MNEDYDLRKLKDSQLLEITQKLVKNEKQQTLLVIAHLEEIQRRRLFASFAFSSMLDYCRFELGYSEAEACVRLSAMRLTKENQLAKKKLIEGEISLTVLSKTSSSIKRQEELCGEKLNQEQKAEIIQSVCGKSTREADLILRDLEKAKDPKQGDGPVGSTKGPSNKGCKILVTESVVKKILALKEIKGNYTDSELIELLLDQELKHTQEKVKTVVVTKVQPPQTGGIRDNILQKNSRYIPVKVRDEVNLRAGGRCEYVDKKTRRRCSEVHRLEYDHEQPYAWNGTANSSDGIYLHCKSHNLYRAIGCFGLEKMDQYINK